MFLVKSFSLGTRFVHLLIQNWYLQEQLPCCSLHFSHYCYSMVWHDVMFRLLPNHWIRNKDLWQFCRDEFTACSLAVGSKMTTLMSHHNHGGRTEVCPWNGFEPLFKFILYRLNSAQKHSGVLPQLHCCLITITVQQSWGLSMKRLWTCEALRSNWPLAPGTRSLTSSNLTSEKKTIHKIE